MATKPKTQTIYSVSEASAIQPRMWTVGNEYHTENKLEKIIIEPVYDTGDPYDFYVGYDTENKRVFQIPVKCAIVQFNS